ncbi:unnamed protein product, partial [Ectocarpus fasciculatus]
MNRSATPRACLLMLSPTGCADADCPAAAAAGGWDSWISGYARAPLPPTWMPATVSNPGTCTRTSAAITPPSRHSVLAGNRHSTACPAATAVGRDKSRRWDGCSAPAAAA